MLHLDISTVILINFNVQTKQDIFTGKYIEK